MDVNIHRAKTHLSRLLGRVQAGEEITISNRGVPVARLVPIATSGSRRKLGIDEGRIWIADDFDAPWPQLEADFQGERRPRQKKEKRS